MRGQLGDFVGGFATEEETKETIKNTYEKTGYVMDTHTAVRHMYAHNTARKVGMKRSVS